jgi:parallel beta-helix repeat protein
VENNVVDGSTACGFALFSAEDVIVRNNQFLNSNTLPTTKPRRVGWGNVYVSNARNITWENNEIRNEGHAYESGLYVDTATVLNFKEQD